MFNADKDKLTVSKRDRGAFIRIRPYLSPSLPPLSLFLFLKHDPYTNRPFYRRSRFLLLVGRLPSPPPGIFISFAGSVRFPCFKLFLSVPLESMLALRHPVQNIFSSICFHFPSETSFEQLIFIPDGSNILLLADKFIMSYFSPFDLSFINLNLRLAHLFFSLIVSLCIRAVRICRLIADMCCRHMHIIFKC